jgi:hypothetical protein
MLSEFEDLVNATGAAGWVCVSQPAFVMIKNASPQNGEYNQTLLLVVSTVVPSGCLA